MSISSSGAGRVGLAAVATVICAVGLLPGAASAASASSGNARATPAISDSAWAAGRAAHGSGATASDAISAYWTPERMRSARPVEEAPFFKAAVARQKRQSTIDRRDARTRAARGQRPAPSAGKFSVAPATGSLGAGSARAATDPNLDPSHPTARTVGKVFFTGGDGLSYVCSASIINSEGADSVWTAGHCVHGGAGGTWHTNWMFAPAFDDDLANPEPYGTWSAASLSTRTAWINDSNFAEDMAVATMNTNFGGWHIVDYLGGHGFAVNQGWNVHVDAFGYPAAPPFSGGDLWHCAGTTSPEWSFLWFFSETLQIPCDMTQGSSGGPWLKDYDGNWGYLNGVNSRIDRIVAPTIMLSPYFDDTALSLYNDTRFM